MKLVIANKNYSSWSLRPWVLMKTLGLQFDEEQLDFTAPDFKARALSASPTGRVPVLVDGEHVVWDSLAIIEYLAERDPDCGVWPKDGPARARARCLAAEMHAGFGAVRARLPMNIEASLPHRGHELAVAADVGRMFSAFEAARTEYGAEGPFLFGAFCAADAMYAPVVWRFKTHAVAWPPALETYRDAMLGLPAMIEWAAAARAEHTYVPEDEPYRTREEAAAGWVTSPRG